MRGLEKDFKIGSSAKICSVENGLQSASLLHIWRASAFRSFHSYIYTSFLRSQTNFHSASPPWAGNGPDRALTFSLHIAWLYKECLKRVMSKVFLYLEPIREPFPEWTVDAMKCYLLIREIRITANIVRYTSSVCIISPLPHFLYRMCIFQQLQKHWMDSWGIEQLTACKNQWHEAQSARRIQNVINLMFKMGRSQHCCSINIILARAGANSTQNSAQHGSSSQSVCTNSCPKV
jgi:hypothetical protein